MGVVLTSTCVVVIVVSLTTILWKKRSRDQRWTMEQHAISPEQLYSLLGSHQDVALFDVRQPLDLLAHSEIIPGARRIPPAEVLAEPLVSTMKFFSGTPILWCQLPSPAFFAASSKMTGPLSTNPPAVMGRF